MRLEIVGWAVLVLAGILWVTRDVIPNRAAAQVTASAVLTMSRGGTNAQLGEAFAAAEKDSALKATLIVERNPALRGVSDLSVTADTPEQAKSGLTAMINAIEAALPATAREGFSASPNNSTYAAPNETSRRIHLAFCVAAVLLIVTAQLMIILGSYWQIGMVRAGLLMKVALPFLFILFSPGSRTGPAGIVGTQSYYIPPGVVSFMLVLLPMSIIPLSLIIWLTRKSQTGQRGHTTSRRA